MAYDKEIKDKFIEMRALGKSFIQIAEELDVCRQTLMNWSKEFESDIKYLQFLQSDSLKIEYGMTLCSRIEHFGIILEKIRNAINEKDFSELPLEKLIDLFFRYFEALIKEIGKIKCKSNEMTDEVKQTLKNIGKVPLYEWDLED